jgi:hypothetical protein
MVTGAAAAGVACSGGVDGGTARSPDDDDTRPFGAPAPAGQQGAEAVEEALERRHAWSGARGVEG